MADLQFVSKDERFGVRIAQAEIDRMKDHCAEWDIAETGGILVGHYNADRNRAIVTKASLAPKDSRRGRTWFVRGVFRLQEWLRELWTGRGEYYLGEWHYHPGGSCQPSGTDARQMEEIALDPKYGCPEPLLIIIGQLQHNQWEIGVYVFPDGKPVVHLYKHRVSQL